LFNYLAAKELGGELILRIEDTDKSREVPGAVEKLLDIIEWLGFEFDEGPHKKGEYGSYVQSERLDIYKKHEDYLLKNKKAYRCFCAPERLQKMREEQQARKEPTRYDRACRNLSEKEIEEKILNKEKFVIRQAVPLDGEVVVKDELRGDIKFSAKELDDPLWTVAPSHVIDHHANGKNGAFG